MNNLPEKSRLRILIADDASFWRTLLHDFMQSFGVQEIRGVGSIGHAWETLQEFRPHMFICDWQMNDGCGLDLVKRVRHAKDSPNRFINVMMVTSFSEEHRVHLAMDAGINGYIAKPFTAGDFLRKFIHCMKDRRPFEVSESYSGPSRSAQLAGAGSSASA